MAQDLQKLLSSWGFSQETPDFIIDHAKLCLECETFKIGEIAVALNVVKRDQVEIALRSKPSNILSLEYLSQTIPAIRPKSLQILAVTRKIPYFAKIDEKFVAQAIPSLSSEARIKLDSLNAACIKTPDDKFMIIFSGVNEYLLFSSLGAIDRKKDPITISIGEDILYGLALPATVAGVAKLDATQAMSVVSSASQDNFWSPVQAKTEAERILARILDEALDRRATDVEIAPMRDGTAKVLIRIFGDMTSPNRNMVLSPENSKEITNFLVSKSRAGDGGRLRRPADGQITYKNATIETFIRCSFIPADRYGLDHDMISSSLRLMPRTSRSINLKDLTISELVIKEIQKALKRTQGLIVLAGPTNSGKSTTIAGAVGEHIRFYGEAKKRISLEDPVERYLDGVIQVTVEDNFAELMRALLRHDPDMIWVGEIRDAFSSAACVRASTSGHIVMSTVHANDAIGSFRAIANYLRKDTGEASGGGASIFDLAESLSLLIGQRLVRKLCPHCKVPHKVTQDELSEVKDYLIFEGKEHLVNKAVESLTTYKVYKAVGCAQCANLGYLGEMPINEVLPVTRAVKDIFTRSETSLDKAELSKHLVISLAESALELIKAGHTELASLFV